VNPSHSGMAHILKASQFYQHTPRSSANGMNHTCLFLPSHDVTYIYVFALKCKLISQIPCTECHPCWLWCHQRERVDQWDISQVWEVVLVDTRTLRVCCCFHEIQPHSCMLHSRFRSTASFSREPVITITQQTFTYHILSTFIARFLTYVFATQRTFF